MSKHAAAPDSSLEPAGKTESPVVQRALRIIRLTRISDAGLNLLVCAIAIFILVPMVAEALLEIDLDETAFTIAFSGFIVLFCGGAVAGIGAWTLARRRFASAEWAAAVHEARDGTGARANAEGRTDAEERTGVETNGSLRSGDALAAAGGATAVTGHVVSSTAPEGSRAEALGDAATVVGGTAALFGLKKWNRSARSVACAVAEDADADGETYWRGAGRAAWLVPAVAYLLALVLSIGGIALGNARSNAQAAAVLSEAVEALEAADGVDYAYAPADAGISTSDDYHVSVYLVESDSYLRIETDETGSVTELSFHFEGEDGWTSAEEALGAAEAELALMLAAVEGTALADPLGLLDAASFSDTFPELVTALDLGADYDHASQSTDTEDGVEVYESATASDGELEFYLTLSAA